jgi:hypothetical protein
MKYNCTIQNESALPLPYSTFDGKDITVGSLFKNKPMFIWVDYITGSNDGQCFRFNCKIKGVPGVLVMPVDSELNIKVVEPKEYETDKPTQSS